MGTIYRTGTRGKLAIRYYDRNGKQRDESAHTIDREVADTLLKSREDAVAKGIPITPQIGKLRYEDAYKLVEADYADKEHDSADNLEAQHRLHLDPWFHGRRMASITTADVAAYRTARRAAGAKLATINRECATLRRAFTLAIQGGLLFARPHIATPTEKNKRTGFYEPAAFAALRAALPAAIRPVVTVAYYTGWRVAAEVLALDAEQIDPVAKVIRLRPEQAKNDDGRVFPYGEIPELVDAIDEALRERARLAAAGLVTSARLFLWREGAKGGARAGGPIRQIRKSWDRARAVAGQPRALMHAFRRTAVRNMERLGVPRSHGKALVGHKTDAIYYRYAIVNEADLAASAGKLAASAPAPTTPPAASKIGRTRGSARGSSENRAGARLNLRIVAKPQQAVNE